MHALTLIGIWVGGGPGEGPRCHFNVLNTSSASRVPPEQPVLAGQLLRGEGRAAGPAEMLIPPVLVEFCFTFLSPLGPSKILPIKTKHSAGTEPLCVFLAGSDLTPRRQIGWGTAQRCQSPWKALLKLLSWGARAAKVSGVLQLSVCPSVPHLACARQVLYGRRPSPS